MMRFVVRVLLASRLRRAVRARIDARYVTKDVHRQDLKDALWEVQKLRKEIIALRDEVAQRREVVALREEVVALRRKVSAPAPKPPVDPRIAQAHRLATQTAESLDHVLQNEVRIWQALDGLSAQASASGPVG